MHLFEPLSLRSVTFRNRAWVSPMCQYSSLDGHAADWHLVHLGSRAAGGAGLVMTEATAIAPEGRISSSDLGIWKDEHVPGLRRIAEFIRARGAAAGIQLAHAGRKAAVPRPWASAEEAADPARSWSPIYGPSPLPFSSASQVPRELSTDEVRRIPELFRAAAARALEAGFEVLEVHAAHGYLLHQFLSPLSNERTDEYGGDRENRMRVVLETLRAVRAGAGEKVPIFLRISAVDWIEGGLTLEDSILLAVRAAEAGADLVDVSSGGNDPGAKPSLGPGYQTAFSAVIRERARVKTSAVGLITSPAQADHLLVTGQADAVFLGRAMLRNPCWALDAARELGRKGPVPEQYLRAW